MVKCYECDDSKAIIQWDLIDYEDDETYGEDLTILKYRDIETPFCFWLDVTVNLENGTSFMSSDVMTLCPYCEGQ